jgi:ribonuclease P protein component
MLPQENRLKKLRDFNLLMKYGRWLKVPDCTLKVLELAKIINYFPKKEDPEVFKNQLKVAVATGLKLSKKAVERNRIRRQVMEVVRLLHKDAKIKNGYYILLVPEKGLLGKDYAEISGKVILLLKQARVLVE